MDEKDKQVFDMHEQSLIACYGKGSLELYVLKRAKEVYEKLASCSEEKPNLGMPEVFIYGFFKGYHQAQIDELAYKVRENCKGHQEKSN